MPVKQCPEGEHITDMKWRYLEMDGLIGGAIVDMDFACSGTWGNYSSGNDYGRWDEQMNCGPAGFRQITGREHGVIENWYMIVNIRAFCSNSQIEMTSNTNLNGVYNKVQACLDGQKVVGIQVQEQTSAINNFRVLCA